MRPPKPPPPRRSRPAFPPDEAPTAETPVKLVRYRKIVATIDHLSDKGADDLTEIACLFADATEAEQAIMLRVCRAVVGS